MARRSGQNETGQLPRAETADSFDQRLKKLKRPQLEALVRGLAADHPDWLPAIETRISSLGSEPAGNTRAPKRAVDTARLRRELHRTWRELGPYETYALVEITREFAERAYRFLENNDGRNAADYSVDAAFGVALEALRVTGEVSPGASPELVTAWLNVLERQGRLDQALDVAHTLVVPDRYLSLLIRLNRLPEAHEYALGRLNQAHDVLEVASALSAHGATQHALELGEHGLSLSGEVWSLARWLRDAALEAGEIDVAIRAGLRVLAERPALDDYRLAQTRAHLGTWATLQERGRRTRCVRRRCLPRASARHRRSLADEDGHSRSGNRHSREAGSYLLKATWAFAVGGGANGWRRPACSSNGMTSATQYASSSR